MAKEIRKETDWLGNPKEVIYEDGQKVGETKQETGWFGGEKKVTYNTDGQKVSETKRETGWFGGEKQVTYDTDGRKISETKYEKDWLGNPKEVIYEDGQKIGELKKEEGLFDEIFGIKKKVLHESFDNNVDLTKRARRKDRTKAGNSDSNDWGSSGYGSSYNYSAGCSKRRPSEFIPISIIVIFILLLVFTFIYYAAEPIAMKILSYLIGYEAVYGPRVLGSNGGFSTMIFSTMRYRVAVTPW